MPILSQNIGRYHAARRKKMSPATTDAVFSGSCTALVTPFDGGQLDKDAFCKLVEWQIESGTDALIPVGTTGESPTLSHEEHDVVVELCIKQAAGRVPVIAGAGSGGGGVGILGEGSSGAGGIGGRTNTSYGTGNAGGGGSGGEQGSGVGLGYQGQRLGATYGGGGGGGGSQFSAEPYHAYNGADGGHGAVRIIWGSGRAFPATNTADV